MPDADGNNEDCNIIEWSQTDTNGSIPAKDRQEEERYLQKVVSAYKQYREYHTYLVQRKQEMFTTKLPKDHQMLVQDIYLNKLQRYRECVAKNAEFLNRLLSGHVPKDHLRPTESEQISKVHSVLKQLARDWSSEGSLERQQTYDPIKLRINQLFGQFEFSNRRNLHILVPGAGVARLAFDLASDGYFVQANEVSMYMLIASNFIFNKTASQQFTIFPYMHTFSNHTAADNQFRAVTIPDIRISGSLEDKGLDGTFSMVAGDFVDVYSSQREQWDCIVTCYFVDTASDIVAYLKTIWSCLKPGGIWINHGPLLYHHEDAVAGKPSLELTLEELLQLASAIGFDIMGCEGAEIKESEYCADQKSMLTYRYRCALFQCQKPIII